MISSEPKLSTFPTPTKQSHHELLERVLASSAFVKSKRLSSLLTYLCDHTLSGLASELNEQHVGEAVFGRPRDYDSMIDGIVRTQASRLRRRLDLYFSEEGASEPVRITIPRGSYVPLFEPRPVAEQPAPISILAGGAPIELEASPAESPANSRANLFRSPTLAWSIAAVLLLALAAVLFMSTLRGHQSQASSPAPAHFIWSKIFPPTQHTLLVPGDSSLVIWQGLKNRNITLDEYIGGAYRDFNPNAILTSENTASNLASRRYTSIVDLEVAEALGRIARDNSGAITVRYPRELRPNDLKQGNLIMVGASEADPWVTLFEHDMNFSLYNDRTRHVFSVLNRTPRANEPRSWDVITTDRQHRVYAIVVWLPNLSGEGHVLLLEGTTMAGTECAWDFVSDDSRLLPFLRSIRRPDGSLPYFEVVLGTNNVSGSAVESAILAYRIRS